MSLLGRSPAARYFVKLYSASLLGWEIEVEWVAGGDGAQEHLEFGWWWRWPRPGLPAAAQEGPWVQPRAHLPQRHRPAWAGRSWVRVEGWRGSR